MMLSVEKREEERFYRSRSLLVELYMERVAGNEHEMFVQSFLVPQVAGQNMD